MNLIKAIRIVGWIEASSFLYLLGIAMPMKYIGGDEHAVQLPGSIHGALFLLFMALLAIFMFTQKPPFKLLIKCGLGSVIPLGPLFYEKSLKTFATASK